MEEKISSGRLHRLVLSDRHSGSVTGVNDVVSFDENEIVLDATGRKNGRGAYVCLSQECLEKAVKSRGLERSLKMAVPAEVYEDLKKELANIEKQQ